MVPTVFPLMTPSRAFLSKKSKTTIGIPLSMHNANAALSITFSRFSSAVSYLSDAYFFAFGSFFGSAV